MPPIKKKSGLKKKKGKKTKEYLPFVNEIPKYQDPEEIYPKAQIILTYADGVGDHFGRSVYNGQ